MEKSEVDRILNICLEEREKEVLWVYEGETPSETSQDEFSQFIGRLKGYLSGVHTRIIEARKRAP